MAYQNFGSVISRCIHLFHKNVVGTNTKWQLSNGDCTTERNCGFHIWYAKTMSSLHGAKLIQQHQRPTGSRLTSLFNINLEI